MLRWGEVSWPHIEENKDELIAVLPTGSVEQHGPHLPLQTDTEVPMAVADNLCGEISPDIEDRLIMLPPVEYTYAKHSNPWPGTLNLSGPTLISLIYDIASEVFRTGISKLIVLNGHMENVQFIEEGMRLALEVNPDCSAAHMNWWDFVSDELIDEVFGDAWPGWEKEHAALTETSLMLAISAEKVDTKEEFPTDVTTTDTDYTLLPESPESLPPSGVFADCTGASAEIGHKILDEITKQMSDAVSEFVKND